MNIANKEIGTHKNLIEDYFKTVDKNKTMRKLIDEYINAKAEYIEFLKVKSKGGDAPIKEEIAIVDKMINILNVAMS